ncbi:DUF998 domain-containing protein [Corynebacterium xerosis]|uniref:DUF998 domain-containing protein n=1 Tax=Corynebacterium xerosis TaxID=1725 RepID=UPI0018C87C0A|nr:DUF998 domain-containing protein [Corynebacterium xerosis]
MTTARVAVFAVAVAAAVAYSSWVLEWFLPGGVDPLRSYASQLAAVAEPHGTLFARADTVSGTLLVVLGALLWSWSRRGRLVPAGLVLWGGATVAGSFFRMPMVTTVGPGASAALTEAEKSAVLVHSLRSSTAAVGMALVGAGLWLIARGRSLRAGRILAGVFLALLAMVAVTSGLHEVGGPNLWLGLWQRLSLAVAAVVIVTVAVAVTSAGSTARREAS